MVVVLFILGLVYALAGPMLGDGVTGLDMKSAARQLAAGLRKARSVAVTERAEAILILDVEGRKFSVSNDAKTYDLPKKLDYTLFTAQSEVSQEKIGSIRFFPDGSSTGGRITVSAGEARQAVDVDWVTGRVQIL
jgi:general secretion pathway protein H